jgi:curved DNA-binding protein CbpA
VDDRLTMKTYYDLLELTSTATLEEIKRNFRREIAKYHPDKVQHLGAEFQEIASSKAAELTRAYKTLTHETQRAEYDQMLRTGAHPAASTAPTSTAPASTAREETPRHAHARSAVAEAEPDAPGRGSVFQQDRAGASQLIFKASVMRFRQALTAEFGKYDEPRVDPFQVACVSKPGFLEFKTPPCVLGRFVEQVDAASVTESWAAAARMKKDGQHDLVVFVMGPAVAATGELAAAISEQRRKPIPGGGKVILVPVNTRTWSAHVPNDAPALVKALLERLKSA